MRTYAGDIPLKPGKGECPFCGDHIMGTRPGRNCSTTCAQPQEMYAGDHVLFASKSSVFYPELGHLSMHTRKQFRWDVLHTRCAPVAGQAILILAVRRA